MKNTASQMVKQNLYDLIIKVICSKSAGKKYDKNKKNVIYIDRTWSLGSLDMIGWGIKMLEDTDLF